MGIASSYSLGTLMCFRAVYTITIKNVMEKMLYSKAKGIQSTASIILRVLLAGVNLMVMLAR